MSKNLHKKNHPRQKKQIVIDEQNEPCCRAIWKKIRNANKKLAEIADLQKKDDLKPEQLEKINRKVGLLEERKRQEEFLDFYKEVLTENAKVYRDVQLKELNNLAEALALASWAKHNPDYQKNEVSKLLEVLSSYNDKQTLQERTEEISSALNLFAENRKVKTWVSDSVAAKATCTYAAPKLEASEKPKPESPKKAKQGPKLEVLKPVESPKKEEQSVQPPAQKAEKKEVPTEQPKEVKAATQPLEKQENAPTEEKKEKKEKNYERDQRNSNRRNRNNEERGNGDHRRKYRSKNKDQNMETRREDKEESDHEEEEERTRGFRKDEVKRLQDDGFTVVGKAKPKAHDQKNWHNQTQGQQIHHKQNY